MGDRIYDSIHQTMFLIIKENLSESRELRHVGNNCWIGAGVVFCDGVTVGSGCVIGANAGVTKSFPDNRVIAGNPAKVVRMRE